MSDEATFWRMGAQRHGGRRCAVHLVHQDKSESQCVLDASHLDDDSDHVDEHGHRAPVLVSKATVRQVAALAEYGRQQAEPVYRMGDEKVPASKMKAWHNSRGLPWGTTFDGPDPITVRRMVPAGTSQLSITVHLANQHSVKAGEQESQDIAHMYAHLAGRFTEGQEHYHRKDPSS